MTFRFLEDIAIADIAFEVEATDLNSLFSDAADAFLAVQIDNPQDLKTTENIKLELSNRHLDILLYQFLQELVYLKDVKGLLLSAQTINVHEAEKGFELVAVMGGEPLDPQRHQERADIKAVTFHSLEAKKTAGGYLARVVLDV